MVSADSNEYITLLLPSPLYAQKGEQYSREAVPPLANPRDSQQLREAQTGKDPKQQLIWKGVPGDTCKEAKQGFHLWILPCQSHGVPPSIDQALMYQAHTTQLQGSFNQMESFKLPFIFLWYTLTYKYNVVV